MALELYRKKQQETQETIDAAQNIRPDLDVYTVLANSAVKNTLGNVGLPTVVGDASPTITVLKRCKLWVHVNAHFNGSTNGVGYSIDIDGTQVTSITFGANPNAGLSGAGGGYVDILEVGQVITIGWSATDAVSRDVAILLEEIKI